MSDNEPEEDGTTNEEEVSDEAAERLKRIEKDNDDDPTIGVPWMEG